MKKFTLHLHRHVEDLLKRWAGRNVHRWGSFLAMVMVVGGGGSGKTARRPSLFNMSSEFYLPKVFPSRLICTFFLLSSANVNKEPEMISFRHFWHFRPLLLFPCSQELLALTETARWRKVGFKNRQQGRAQGRRRRGID